MKADLPKTQNQTDIQDDPANQTWRASWNYTISAEPEKDNTGQKTADGLDLIEEQ